MRKLRPSVRFPQPSLSDYQHERIFSKCYRTLSSNSFCQRAPFLVFVIERTLDIYNILGERLRIFNVEKTFFRSSAWSNSPQSYCFLYLQGLRNFHVFRNLKPVSWLFFTWSWMVQHFPCKMTRWNIWFDFWLKDCLTSGEIIFDSIHFSLHRPVNIFILFLPFLFTWTFCICKCSSGLRVCNLFFWHFHVFIFLFKRCFDILVRGLLLSPFPSVFVKYRTTSLFVVPALSYCKIFLWIGIYNRTAWV
jgi:hypothetical protein